MSATDAAPNVVEVDTPVGPGRLFVDAATRPELTLVLGHGAGGGVGAPDLALLARALPPRGISVVRFEQPWRTAGRKVAVAPPRLDVAWRAAVAAVTATGGTGPLVLGGRSAGARVACRTADALGAVAVVCLAFPLHPPGRPERSRVTELATPSVPRLVLQGTRDTFGGPAEVRTAVAAAPDAGQVEVVELTGADHGFRVPARGELTPADLRERVLAAVTDFLRRLPIDPGSARE